jgi:hydroxyacylglutathione hydrolase
MKITEHIHALKIPFEITDPSGLSVPRFVYIYLIYGEKIYLIDSGVASSERIIVDYLKKTNQTPEEISILILTHAHPDHMGAAQAVKEMSGCSVASHSADKDWIENPDQQFMDRPVPGFKALVEDSVRVDRILQDGDILDLGNRLKLVVLHTPGHSPGSISLWMPHPGVLFSADAIPVSGAMPIYDDIQDSVRSIQRLKTIKGIKVLLSAWDEPQHGMDAYRIMDQGFDYLQRIHSIVIKSAETISSQDAMELCRQTIKELGLPSMMANPLTSRSFQSSLKVPNKYHPSFLIT